MNESGTGAATTEAIADTETVCRPHPATFWLGLLMIASGVFFMCGAFLPGKYGEPPPVLGRLFFIGSGLVPMFFGVLVILRLLRFRIIADETGLRWRDTWHGYRSATWAQVSDYYTDRHYLRRQSTDDVPAAYVPMPVIVTDSGVVRTADRLQSSILLGLDDLKRIVWERATSARVDCWQPLGTRRVDDFPQTFRYWNPGDDTRFAWRMVGHVAFFAALGYVFVRLALSAAAIPFMEADDIWKIAGGLTAAYLTLLSLPVLAVTRYMKAWKRRGESITVTPETVRHEDTVTGVVRESAWRDVSDYFYRASATSSIASRYTLVLPGADEPEISWDVTLYDTAHLLALVQTFASPPGGRNANTDTSTWRDKGIHEKTGGSDPATWQGGAVGMGGRVFRLRGVEVALLLGFGTSFVLFLAIFCICEWLAPGVKCEWLAPGVKDERPLALGITAFFALPTLWGWVCYFRSRVETDDIGITQYTPLGKKYLPWFAVADYRGWGSKRDRTSSGITVEGHNKSRLRLWATLNGYDDLKAEIERYAPAPRTGFNPAPKLG